MGIRSKDRLAFGSAVKSLLSPTIGGGEVALPLRHLPAQISDKNCPASAVDGFGVFFPISMIGIIHK